MATHTEIIAVVSAVLCVAVPSAPAFGVWYVKPTPTGSGNCSSWANACSLPTALAAAPYGEIWVKKGIYQLTEAIRLKDHLKIIGGFNGNETAASQSKPFVNATILRGGGGFDEEVCGQAPLPIVYSKGNEITAALRGFVLENGNAPGETEIYCSGGALLIVDGDADIINCTFRNNFGWLGGAVAVYGEISYPIFSNCIFHGNGRKVVGTDPQTQQPIYQRNYAGGAVALWMSKGEFHNCLFYDNHSYEGGAVWIHPDAPTGSVFYSATMTDNVAGTYGGAVSMYGQSGRITSSIVRGNIPDNVHGSQRVTYSNATGEWRYGSDNIDADPMFINAAARDYRIKYQSPCRNVGALSYGWDNSDLDWDGHYGEQRTPLDLALKPRVAEGRVDIGAYETACAAPPVLDCNGNSIPDACDITEGTSPDCNNNAVPDSCDLAADPTLDCYNSNGIPDSCEAAAPKGACCTSPCTAQQTHCRCAALGGSAWGPGSCFSVCSGGGN